MTAEHFGIIWLLLTAAIGHYALFAFAVKGYKRNQDMAKIGEESESALREFRNDAR